MAAVKAQGLSRRPVPRIEVDLDKLRHNARFVVDACSRLGIRVAGVTKVTCAMPEVARALLDGGVSWLADSRTENLARLKASGLTGEFIYLRGPMQSRVQEVVELADISLCSDVATVRLLGDAAQFLGIRHRVIMMVDVGDLREGVMPEDALDTARAIAETPGVELYGIGTNHACFGGVMPTVDNVSLLVEIAESIRRELGIELPIVSGGNSTALRLVFSGTMPKGVSQLRVGESIMLGVDVNNREPIPGMYQDAFTLVAEVIEVQRKPSVPIGCIGQDAFGNVPVFVDRGIRDRVILGIGRQDVKVDGIKPLTDGAEVLGGSSDHLIVDVTEAVERPVTGDEMRFRPDYGALLAAMTSPYVAKVIV